MTDAARDGGPLHGVRVLEFAGLGPVPFAGMLLSDMGADVVRIERPDVRTLDSFDISARGRLFVPLDLKTTKGIANARSLAAAADIVLEGFRPGVLERLGLGPDVLLRDQPALVIGRMTGWGQLGPLASAVGHDINYIALTGALDSIGTRERPVPPLNLVGDYGGGAMFLVTGVLAALVEARASGSGQVVDCAMVDGALNLMALFQGWRNAGQWEDRREANLLDGAAPFYTTYECRDGRHIAVGCIEPQFYAAFCRLTGFSDPQSDAQHDRSRWPWRREALGRLFKARTRAQWCELLEGTDACVSPVLGLGEVASHPHIVARGSMVNLNGQLQAAPAPRFSRTPSGITAPPSDRPSSVGDVLERWRTSGKTQHSRNSHL